MREALERTVLSRRVREPDTLVVHELGLRHGKARVDVAVVNGHLHGYEIKSEMDRLDRLARQVEAYGLVFDKATLVAAESHLDAALSVIPNWWGVRIAIRRDGHVQLRRYRSERINRDVSALAIAELLWKEEALGALAYLGLSKAVARLSRAEVYKLLVQSITITQLRRLVRLTLRSRVGWRDRPALA